MSAHTQAVLALLQTWTQAGWLGRLDRALAQWIDSLDPNAQPRLLIATAFLVHMERLGHSCLPLTECLADPEATLSWPQPAQPALTTLLHTLGRQPNEWLADITTSPCVWQVGVGVDTAQPLVVDGPSHQPRLYLRRYWDYEQRLHNNLAARLAAPLVVDEANAHAWLQRLFEGDTADLNWQKMACAMALRGRFTIITGGPGTGKTYTAARLLALLWAVSPQPTSLRVALAAPTGKAAARLKQAIDHSLLTLAPMLAAHCDLAACVDHMGPARTLHALLGTRPHSRAFRANAHHPLDLDVLVVDEASMVNLELIVKLLEALPAHTRVVLLGDKDQLASVEAGAVFADMCRCAAIGAYDTQTVAFAKKVADITLPTAYQASAMPAPVLAQHTVMLRVSHRFGGVIGQLAQAVNEGEVARALALLNQGEAPTLAYHPSAPLTALWQVSTAATEQAAPSYVHYLALVRQGPLNSTPQAHADWVRRVMMQCDRVRVLCAVREGQWGVQGVNAGIESALQAKGLLQPNGLWYAGRPVLVTRNDAALGLFNGDTGLVLPGYGSNSGLKAYFLDGQGLKAISVGRMQQVETAFAMTVHKSQGSEYEHVVLVLPHSTGQRMGKELLYTGITRAKSCLTVMAQSEGVVAQAIGTRTQRASGLGDWL